MNDQIAGILAGVGTALFCIFGAVLFFYSEDAMMSPQAKFNLNKSLNPNLNNTVLNKLKKSHKKAVSITMGSFVLVLVGIALVITGWVFLSKSVGKDEKEKNQ